MRLLRALLALLIIAASVTVARRMVLPSIECNAVKGRANAALMSANRTRSTYEEKLRTQQMAAECARCLEQIPNDPELWTLLAWNQYRLGQDALSEQNYRRALALSERPETYAFLALLQLDHGKVDEARQTLYQACIFDISLVEVVSSPLREEVYEAVMQRHERLSGKRPAR